MRVPRLIGFDASPLRLLLVCILLLPIPSAGPLMAQDTKLLGTARTMVLKSDVVYNKNRKTDSAAVPLSRIYRTGILKLFREVETNPDIIVKLHKDVFLLDSETISITVFNAEDNSVLFSEERKLVDKITMLIALLYIFWIK